MCSSLSPDFSIAFISKLLGFTKEKLPSAEFLEKLIIAQLVYKIASLYETRRFINVFTIARHWTLSWAAWIHSVFSRPIFVRSILINLLSFHLRPCFSYCLFPSDFLTKILYAFLFVEHYKVMKFCEIFSIFLLLSLWSKYSPQYHVPTHPQVSNPHKNKLVNMFLSFERNTGCNFMRLNFNFVRYSVTPTYLLFACERSQQKHCKSFAYCIFFLL